MTITQCIYKCLLALALVCGAPAVIAEELCATQDSTTSAAHPNQAGQSTAMSSGFSVVKGRRYDVALRMDGWAGVRSGKNFGWARESVFSACPKGKSEMVSSRGASLAKSGASVPAAGRGAEKLPGKQSALSSPRSTTASSAAGCPCGGGKVCVGPRGGRYCITSGGSKRYGV